MVFAIVAYFSANIFEAFLPVALFIGLAWRGARSWRDVALTVSGALGAGLAAAFFWSPPSAAALLVSTAAQILAALLLTVSGGVARAAGALLLAGAAFGWAGDPELKILAASRVVNTDLLLNLSGIAVAFALTALLARLCRRLADFFPCARAPLTVTFALLTLTAPAGHALLALMKLEMLELTARRLTLVSLATNFPWAPLTLTL
ncbi:MAG: hypothetical protein LBD30_03890, partial [Verrucomicrobiales bacterium]|nr:hypothetical protein [Verrucomicrobiales bacterium]